MFERFWCCEVVASVQNQMNRQRRGDNPPITLHENRPAETRQVEPASSKPRAQHSSTKPPSTEESPASNGLDCELTITTQVCRELPGIRLLANAWVLAKYSSIEEGLAEICYLLSPTLVTSLVDLTSAHAHAWHVCANKIGLPRGSSHIKLMFPTTTRRTHTY